MRKKSFSRLLIAFLLAAVSVTSAFAQVTTGTLWGTVKDESGGVLPGVTVTIEGVETGFTRTVVTDDAGQYRASSLPPGLYEVSAQLPGFKRALRSGIRLSVAQMAMIPLTLQIGEMSEQVVVTGEASLVDTRSSSLSGLVDGSTIVDLPLNGRSFDQLAILNPGVTRYYVGGQNLQNGPGIMMSFSGARPESTYYMLDGTNILDHSNFTPGSAAGNNLGVDAIQEFRVFTHNYSAEIGVRAGGAISIVTKSGTNEFHGSLFAYHRNDNLDARNFFDPGAPPEFKRNQFGFSVGGPIVEDKTFFFANVEWLRQRLGTTLIANVPTAEARQGIIPNLPDPVVVNPAVIPYLDLFPLPNGRDFGDGTGEFIDAFSNTTDESYFMARIDHRFSDNDSLFGRYTFDDTTAVSAGGDLARFVDLLTSRNQFFTLQETHIFNQNTLNEVRVAFNRTNPTQDSVARPAMDQSLKFFPEATDVGGISSASGRGPSEGAGLAEIGIGGNVPRRFTLNNFQVSDNVTHRVGRHSLKSGFDFQRLQLNCLCNEDTNGAFGFTGLVNLLRGTPDDIGAQAPGSNASFGWRQVIFGTYIQDDFNLFPNLTLNLGFRWEFTTIPTEVNGKIANLVNVLDPAPTIGFFYEDNNSLRNFAPRIGLAWDPWSDGKTAVRSGVGIFHSQVINRNYYTYALRQVPFLALTFDTNPPFPNPFINGVASILQENDRIDPNLKTPTLYHWNLTIQRELIRDLAFEIGYVGSKGANLLRAFPHNTAIPEFLSDGTPFFSADSTTKNPNFSSILGVISDVNSWYHSLQLAVNKRFSHGLRLHSTYNWGRSLDEASLLQRGQGRNNIHLPQNPLDRSGEKGQSSFQVEHSFTFNFTYDVPRRDNFSGVGGVLLNGWQLGGIVNLNSGIPLNLETGFNQSRDRNPTAADRASLKTGVTEIPILGGPDRYFDTSVIELPPAGTYGNIGRNIFNAPGLATVDFSLIKKVRLGEGRTLDFRTEVFNILNRANFNIPRTRGIFSRSGAIRGSTGRIRSTVTTSRQIQFAMRLSF